MPAAKSRRRTIESSARGRRATPNPCASRSTRARSATAVILQIYFSVAHDPTQLNRQGPDTGTQYRSAIFAETADQAKIAKAYIAQLNQAGVFDAAIVTKISQLKGFYPAEDYHQNYLTLHPTAAYIVINDLPKVENLRRIYPDLYRANPVLVAASGMSN